jgi:hypothetical protein
VRIRNQKDFWSGVLFIVTGLLFMALSRQYTIGTAAKMGPGYFPTILGGLMALLGLLILLPSIRASQPVQKIARVDFMSVFMVLLSVVVYAATLPTLGFIVSLVLLVVISSFASHEFHLKSTIISALVLLAGSWLVFVKGLELQFPFLPVFLTR